MRLFVLIILISVGTFALEGMIKNSHPKAISLCIINIKNKVKNKKNNSPTITIPTQKKIFNHDALAGRSPHMVKYFPVAKHAYDPRIYAFDQQSIESAY